jgi:uncharacterized surface protein with fasciclin (FAS1) repeats
MQLIKTWRLARLASILALVLVAIPYAVTAQNGVASSTVSGNLNEQFAKHYLGLQVIDPTKPAKIKMDYQPQHSSLLDGNSGFYLFTASGLDSYTKAAPPSESAFRASTLEMMDGVKRKVAEIPLENVSTVTALVTYNDTTMALSYTLTGENVRFLDDSGEQVVTVGTAAPTSTPNSATTAPDTATATPESATTGAVRSVIVTGELNEQFAKHYLGLEVIDTGQPVTIKMDYQPQDSQQLDDNSGFYVFKAEGFARYTNASPASETAFRTGSMQLMEGIKQKTAQGGADHASTIVTLVTYNDTTMSLSYTLTGENVKFIDESGEQVNGDRAPAPAQTTDGTATPAPAGTDITLGSSYTVQSGDTLGTISTRAYGTDRYWSAICTANSLANCDHIEIGDVLTIPTQSQADEYLSGSVATPAPTADAMPEPTTEATPAPTAEAMPEPTAEATAAPTSEAMPEPTEEADSGLGNLIEVAEDYEELDILLLAVDLAGLSATISDGGPFTIFAPTNAAFASLPEARLDMLMADSVLLAETLKYHVVSGKLTAADLATQTSLTTLQGGTILISTSDDGSLGVEGVSIVTSDVMASNGVIHFIHQLLPDPEENSSQ